MELHDKLAWLFFFMVLTGMGVLMYEVNGERYQCIDRAMAENYTADHIRKICR